MLPVIEPRQSWCGTAAVLTCSSSRNSSSKFFMSDASRLTTTLLTVVTCSNFTPSLCTSIYCCFCFTPFVSSADLLVSRPHDVSATLRRFRRQSFMIGWSQAGLTFTSITSTTLTSRKRSYIDKQQITLVLRGVSNRPVKYGTVPYLAIKCCVPYVRVFWAPVLFVLIKNNKRTLDVYSGASSLPFITLNTPQHERRYLFCLHIELPVFSNLSSWTQK